MPASRVWFITGASSKALASGEKVVATLRKPEVIASLAEQYGKDKLIVLKVDVKKEEDITAAFTAAKEAFGRIDVVFNNAGYGVIGIEGTSDKNARDLFEVNFWGSVKVTQQAVAFMRDVNQPQGGLLINMSSMFGIDAPPAAGFYAATFQVALDAVTDSIHKELDPAWNIKVIVFCPGWFKTNMTLVNAVVEDPHPAYASNPALGSMQVRKFSEGLIRGDSPALQDADKLINKFWDICKLENPPYRLAFGDDAKACFQARWTALKGDLEASEEWSKDLTFNN
ncbi:NAD-P-binding protein [Mycena rebaudengoi]|nr:NAD-P-binding protein [Mycena rebaudengoi]